jgi:hypothetical protein
MPSSNEDSRRARAGEHATEIAADRTSTYHRNARPLLKLTHRLIRFAVRTV